MHNQVDTPSLRVLTDCRLSQHSKHQQKECEGVTETGNVVENIPVACFFMEYTNNLHKHTVTAGGE